VVMVGPFPGDEEEGLNKSDKAWEAPNCFVAPDWREAGEGLAPDGDEISAKMTAEKLQARRRVNGGALSEGLFQAIIQQDPAPAGGGRILPRQWFPKVHVDPDTAGDGTRLYSAQAVAFDLAGTEGAGDATAWCLMGGLREGTFRIRHSGRAWKGTGAVKRLIAAVWFLYCRSEPRPTVVLPVSLGEAGKIALDGLSGFLREISVAAGVPTPIVRGRSVKTVGKGEEFRSAKHARMAYHGGSLRETAEPKLWNRTTGVVDVYGDVSIFVGQWHAAPFSEVVTPARLAESKHGEDLAEIGRLYAAIARHVGDAEIKALSVDRGHHATEALEEFHNFSGYDGGQDNLVDATADAKTALPGGRLFKPYAASD